ncbi:Type III restriction-modification system methylation subunit [Snodgrassella alvi wkB2]|uniref:site-specific DNA-methyltransferase n=1 Tax=Snodgrassella alvi TaxID=1196083 RepID=UPI00042E5899|nr:DNA methyltransferase [Snodgrassella alvi]AHN29123.1 Type III restriction-modification system methylation subunit [Snodgrassella alvi wkB2]ORF01734.1 site-specific DNA-methyltransferase [Snodgrassella alvi]
MNTHTETLFSEVETANSKQLAVLKANFPQCFDKNGAFIQEKLLEIVKSSDVELSKESYSLNWLGKSYARLLANLPPKTLLTEDKDHNQREENKNSQNLLIKGDNLEVLKHMVNAYAEKVKMIYIDPPYNTGSDGFAYNDDRKFTPEQLSELAGIDIDEATRILDFTVKGSSSHSAWLTFMYPRLYIAKELLSENGAIFISIDDNEASELKILCNEVFGSYNFLANIVWEKVHTRKNSAKHFSTSHEHIIVFAKDKTKWDRVLLPRDDLSAYNNPDNHPKGPWKLDPITAHNEYKADYKIKKPNGVVLSRPKDRYWVFSEETINQKIADNEISWGEGDSYPMVKRFLSEVQDGLVPTTLFTRVFAGDTSLSKKEIDNLLGFKGGFDYSKPTKLIKKLLQISSRKNDIIMDFFAGSGTTANAVFDINTEENSNRKFISIQIPEKCKLDSEAFINGFKTIFDITKVRIIKSAEKIKSEHPNYKGDLGFKIFKTIDDFRTKNNSELTLSNHTFFDDVVLTPEQYDTLLTTWCVYDGSLLTTPIEDVDLDGYKAHLCDGRLYLIAPNFTSKALKALLQKLDSDKDFAPNKVVFYGSNFESAKQLELNEALKNYANKKSIDLDLVVRN